MRSFAVITDGMVTSIVQAEKAPDGNVVDITGIEEAVLVGFYYDGGSFSYSPIPVVDTRITKLAFKQRLTQTERISVREAAKVNPEVYDFQDLVDSATFVDLSRQETVVALNTLEAAGLLGVGRANEILTAPILDIERFKG